MKHHHSITHNMYKHPLYRIYWGIKMRCENSKIPNYFNYGSRGIKCLWKTFEDFRDDMLASYKPGLSIDRIDVNGHYCKENCRWTTDKEQNRNTRKNRFLKFNNIIHCVSEWAEILNINEQTIFTRLRRGWSIKETLSITVRSYHHL